MKIAIATRNPGKAREIEALVSKVGVELTSLLDLGLSQVEETGSTFEENAVLKAKALAKQTGLWALADDSGLEVDALGGAPGVRSARFAGDGAGDDENNRKLLDALAAVPQERRGAQFRCVIALASPAQMTWITEGVCRGRIAQAPSGQGGFGYDPLFVPEGFDKTFAEMTPEEKAEVSHRGIALRKMAAVIESLVRARGGCA